MSGRAAILLSLLLAGPAPAQEAPFATEAGVSFGYLGGKVDEPVVAIDGAVSGRYAYREDSTGHGLGISATRFFGGVPDDGTTPLALLPFVARRSALSASVALSERSRDSYGVSRGAESTVESRLTADAGSWGGALDGTWFLRPELALHGIASAGSFRETQALSSVQSPNGALLGGSVSPKRDHLDGSLGVLFRPAPELAVELAGTGATATEKATEMLLIAGAVGGPPVTQGGDSRTDSSTLGASLSGTLLVAERRVALEAGASYAATHGDSSGSTALIVPYVFHTIARSMAGAATWFPRRDLGLTLGAAYGTDGATRGFDSRGELRSESTREVAGSGAVRWFPLPRASVALVLSRTVTETISPPENGSYTKLRAADDRVTLTGALRF